MNENNIKEMLSDEASTDAEFWKRKQVDTPIWEKAILTVVEAAKFFQIGEQNIRRITREYKDEDFILWMDNRVYIRRIPFETFLDGRNEI